MRNNPGSRPRLSGSYPARCPHSLPLQPVWTIPHFAMLASSSSNVSAAGNVDTRDSEGVLHRPHTITRPIPVFHSTRAIFVQHNSSAKEIVGDRPHARWSSRASRKNRYSQRSVRIAHAQHAPAKGEEPPLHELSSHIRPGFTIVEQRIRHSESRLKVHLAWDISFWVAVVFVLGSTIWVRSHCSGCLVVDDAWTDNDPW